MVVLETLASAQVEAQERDSAAARSLRDAGAAMGRFLAERIRDEAQKHGGVLTAERFWSTLSELLRRRGWGRAEHAAPHPGVGVVSLRSGRTTGPEGLGATGAEFIAGLLAGVFEHTVEREVDVLPLRPDADGTHAFAFGSREALRAFSDALARADGSVDGALRAL
jgi:hypothetical protein